MVLWQVQSGFEPIGPTGSTAVIVGAVVLVILLAYSLHAGWEVAYILVSAVVSMLALSAVHSSMTSSSTAWPSQFWQAAGLTINVIGVTTFIIVVALYVRSRRESRH